MTIREATAADLTPLSRLYRAFRNEHSRMIGGPGELSQDAAREEVGGHLKRRDTGYWVAVAAEGELIGFRRWELGDGFYFTRELYVLPEARRRGVAGALIRHLERWLLEQGQDLACISLTPHNLGMIQLARAQGYDTLNTIELRKDLERREPEPRGEVEALGLRWRIR
jgi:GNAT superfamily N-acetyltransferase